MYEQQDLKLVGSRIKAVRISRGMSQADLAVEASVSLPLISNIERGKTGMQLETFAKWRKPFRYLQTICSAQMYRRSKQSIKVSLRSSLKTARPVRWKPS